MVSSVNDNSKYLKLRNLIPIDKVNWYELSSNPNAIHILEKNLDKVHWHMWHMLSMNPNAIHILEKNWIKYIGICCQEILMLRIFLKKT